MFNESGAASVSYSLIGQGGVAGLDTNVSGDPLFVDFDNGDYRLFDASPAVDSGNNAAVPAGINTDLAGGPRFVDDAFAPDCPQAPDTCGKAPIVDMGAFEDGLPFDSDGDGTPDVDDGCPFDANKIEPGVCGCRVLDTDSDRDNLPDCVDQCPSVRAATPNGCGGACLDPDEDGWTDEPPGQPVQGEDGDGVPDDVSQCPGTAPGQPVDADGCATGDDGRVRRLCGICGNAGLASWMFIGLGYLLFRLGWRPVQASRRSSAAGPRTR